MTFILITAFTTAIITILAHHLLLRPLFLEPLARIPGPKLYALTKWRLAWDDWTGRRTRAIHELHLKYGPVVRIGPNEVHFNSLSALRSIYGAGSGFERSRFYSMFDVYGKKNLFTFGSVAEHASRKRILAHAYSKSVMMKGYAANIISEKIRDFLDFVSRSPQSEGVEIFAALHYYAIDIITTFLYGRAAFGATGALQGDQRQTVLLNDIMDPSRRRLSWFAVHLPALTAWLYTRMGLMEPVVATLLPMKKPATYTGIRAHALKAMQSYRDADIPSRATAQDSIIARLWRTKDQARLDDRDIASECADHLLAGIDTTSDTLMFLIWTLSLPQNAAIQERLIQVCRSLPDTQVRGGVVDIEVADRLGFLDAILKETLRLFAPLPASEPRSSPVNTVIDGYQIPKGTVCSMAPFSLHRNEHVFPEPTKWDPYRWMRKDDDPVLMEMKRWWWPFSSGARMCIGMQ
jgi:cytochrome P450